MIYAALKVVFLTNEQAGQRCAFLVLRITVYDRQILKMAFLSSDYTSKNTPKISFWHQNR